MPSTSEGAWVPIGRLGRARGLAGELWLRAFHDGPSALRDGVEVQVEASGTEARTLRVATVHAHPQGLALAFRGVGDRASAEALTGATVSLRRSDFPPLEEGEFYHHDLIGIGLFDESGAELGSVSAVIPYPSVDALVVRCGDREVEVPIVDDIVRSIDTAGRRAVVDRAVFDEL